MTSTASSRLRGWRGVPTAGEARIYLLSVALACLAAITWRFAPALHLGEFHATTWVTLLVAYAVAEMVQVHVEVRRQTLSLSLSEIPLVFGLFLVPPMWHLAARLLAAAAVVMWRRRPALKTAFNLSLWALEPAIATVVLSALTSDRGLGPSAWLAAYLAVAAADAFDGVAVLIAVGLHQGRFRPGELRHVVPPLIVSGALNTTVALIVLLTVRSDVRAVLLLLIFGCTLALGYRTYSALLRRHSALGHLYDFTRALRGRETDTSAVIDTVLQQTRVLLHAEHAAWYAPGEAAEDPLRASVLRSGQSLLLPRTSRDDAVVRWLAATGHAEAMLAPLSIDAEVVGVLEVADRMGDMSTFTADDLRVLETVAAHTSYALENGRLVDKLLYDAHHDALTGLANRARFRTEVTTAVAAAREARGGCAVLLMDLDRFKEVNDTLGHWAGDELLCEIARRLRAAAPAGATVARLGGDEFAILVPFAAGTDSRAVAEAVAAGLLAALAEPVPVQEITVAVGGSVGVALFPEHGDDERTLLQRADIAMYAAKTSGLAQQTYDDGLDHSSTRRLALAGELRRALGDGTQLVLYYQPKVALDSGRIVGAEALVRWQHPAHGLIPPDEFVPLAEQTGLIGALTGIVLRQALDDCRRWLDGGYPLGIAVNVSVRGLLDETFPDEVAALLAAHDVPAELLTLEITESSVMADPARTLPVLNRLHSMGVVLSVDDFGTGYSSLAYLRRLPVDEVKIDKSFLRTMTRDDNDAAIVRAIVELGRSLGLRVVAEGIEDAATYAAVAAMGCSTGQGYVISRPVPVTELGPVLAHRRLRLVPVQVPSLHHVTA